MEPLRDAEIAFMPAAWSSEVLVEEGQPVKKGELLIRLGGESDSNYAAAQFEVVSAQKALNDLRNDSEADLAQAVIDLKQAKEDYEKAENVFGLSQNRPKRCLSRKRSCITSKEEEATRSGSGRTSTRVPRLQVGSPRLRTMWH